MSKIKIVNEKYGYCPECGDNYSKYNDQILLLKRVSFVIFDKKTGEIMIKCAKCKKEIKIS